MSFILYFEKSTGSIKEDRFHIVAISTDASEIRREVASLDKIIEEHKLSVEFEEHKLLGNLATM